MIAGRPVLTFDTTVHNRLVDDGTCSEVILAALQAGFFVRIAGLVVEELIATPDPNERQALMAGVGRLQHGPHDCLLPQNELLRKLINAYDANANTFQWQAVDVSSRNYSLGIGNREMIRNNQLASEQRQHLMEEKKNFERPFAGLRLNLDEVIERHGQTHPLTFSEVLPMIQQTGGLAWSLGKGLFESGGGTIISEEGVRNFMNRCPPFCAVVYSLLLAWYDRSLRDRHSGEKFRAGRVDLFMAVYLPYCDQFITAEKHAEHEKCLQEIVRCTDLEVKVRSYDDFCTSLFLTRTGSAPHQP